MTISPEITNLIVGFLLTTLCGGLLGFVFQRRHARYQWLRDRAEKEMDVCQGVFEEVSRLLDKRLYRARQLLHFLRDQHLSQEKLAGYREVVTQWNENINRILALLTISFGQEIRDALDYDVGAEFVGVGRLLEEAIKTNTNPDSGNITRRLDALSNKVYQFNIKMLELIQAKHNKLHEF